MTEKKENFSKKNTDEKISAEKQMKPSTEENSASDVQSSECNQEDKELQAEYQKLKDSYLRACAEVENTKKRCQQEIEKISKFAIASFAKELLSVADNMQRALSAVNENDRNNCEALVKGIELTQNELTKVFNKFGIKKLDSLNKIFDPNFERVVQEVEDKEKPAGTIISELQAAYTLNDRILREAMVIVTKK